MEFKQEIYLVYSTRKKKDHHHGQLLENDSKCQYQTGQMRTVFLNNILQLTGSLD